MHLLCLCTWILFVLNDMKFWMNKHLLRPWKVRIIEILLYHILSTIKAYISPVESICQKKKLKLCSQITLKEVRQLQYSKNKQRKLQPLVINNAARVNANSRKAKLRIAFMNICTVNTEVLWQTGALILWCDKKKKRMKNISAPARAIKYNGLEQEHYWKVCCGTESIRKWTNRSVAHVSPLQQCLPSCQSENNWGECQILPDCTFQSSLVSWHGHGTFTFSFFQATEGWAQWIQIWG